MKSDEALGGYKFISRFKSQVAAEVFVAECLLGKPGERALIVHAPRDRPDFPALETELYADAAAQPAIAHPAVTSILDFFESDDGLYLVLEHVVGSDLFTLNAFLASQSSALSLELTAYIVMSALLGLHHLHTCPRADGAALGSVIEGLAPERVRLVNTGDVKLSNDTLARVVARPEHAAAGPERFGYRPVEWIAGEPENPASNVYTMGVIMFELLMGRPCFVGKTTEDVLHQVATRGVRVQELAGNGVPPPLCAIVERATRTVPEQRYTTAREMAQSLADWLSTQGAQDMRSSLARFLREHRLVGRQELPEEVNTLDLPPVDPTPPAPKPETDSGDVEPPFGLRKPARRTTTKVGLRK